LIERLGFLRGEGDGEAMSKHSQRPNGIGKE
jgi:hypothetical protein